MNFAIDHFTGRENNFVIGQRYDIATPAGTLNFELVGYLYFLDPETRIALQTVSWDMETTRQLCTTEAATTLSTASSRRDQLTKRWRRPSAPRVGPDIEVISQQDNIDESNAEFAGNIDRIQSLLLAFAVIVLIISGFITYNTFTLVMGQRIRELGLLRVLGAERRQIAQVVAVEALIVGVVATIVGFGLGILLALGIASTLNSAGAHLPAIDVIIGGWTVVASVLIASV